MTHKTCNLAGRLFRQLVDLFQFYMAFPIDNFSSSQLSDNDVISSHYERIQQLQLLLFYKHPALKELALNNCGTVASRAVLADNLAELQEDELRKLVTRELRYMRRVSRGSLEGGRTLQTRAWHAQVHADYINQLPSQP